MHWIWYVLEGCVALGVLVAATGAMLPVAHAAARRARFQTGAAALYAAITDLDALPSWRKDLKSVQRLPDRDGRPCYREIGIGGPMELVVESAERDRLLITRIATPRSPFGGTWTFRIEPSGSGATLTITENGEIYNVIFRALARFVIGYTSVIDGYLQGLAGKFGETVAIETAAPEPAPPAKARP